MKLKWPSLLSEGRLLQEVVGHAQEAPFRLDFGQSTQEKSSKLPILFDVTPDTFHLNPATFHRGHNLRDFEAFADFLFIPTQ